jgi:hypothetical protein
MFKKLLPAFLVSAVLFHSCSKSGGSGTNNNNGGNNGGNGNTLSAYLTHTGTFIENASNGDLIEKGAYSLDYNKVANTVTQYEYDTLDTQIRPDTIICSLAGHIITGQHTIPGLSHMVFMNPGHNVPDSFYNVNGAYKTVFSYTYTFNSNGQVISQTEITKGYHNEVPEGSIITETTNYTWQNGNLIKSETPERTITYVYDETTEAAQPDEAMLPYSPFQNLAPCKNIIKTVTYSYTGSSTVYTLAYTYDSKGRVVSTHETDNLGNNLATNAYTYY